jgi:hypothetical protein
VVGTFPFAPSFEHCFDSENRWNPFPLHPSLDTAWVRKVLLSTSPMVGDSETSQIKRFAVPLQVAEGRTEEGAEKLVTANKYQKNAGVLGVLGWIRRLF